MSIESDLGMNFGLSSSRRPLPASSPLRTVHETFASYGSSILFVIPVYSPLTPQVSVSISLLSVIDCLTFLGLSLFIQKNTNGKLAPFQVEVKTSIQSITD